MYPPNFSATEKAIEYQGKGADGGLQRIGPLPEKLRSSRNVLRGANHDVVRSAQVVGLGASMAHELRDSTLHEQVLTKSRSRHCMGRNSTSALAP